MTVQPKVLFLGIGALVLIAVGSIVAVLLTSGDAKPATTAPATFALRGTVVVNCPSTCSGYSDITVGSQVEVLNQHNEVLAVGQLESGYNPQKNTNGVSPDYVFMIPVVPRGQGLYGVHIGNANRGVIWKPESDAATTGFQLIVADLGELAAKWLTGEITYQPAYDGDRPDEETNHFAQVLAEVNRAGYFTYFSQPGVALTDGYGQRAAVAGWCNEDFLATLKAVAYGTPVCVISIPPASASEAQIVVTMDAGDEYTWIGQAYQPDDGNYSNDLHPTAVSTLHASWQVHIFDPEWGRDDLLWRVLRITAAHAAPAP